MGDDFTELNKSFKPWLFRFKEKTIPELEIKYGECNKNLDYMFDLMLKNNPAKKTENVAVFGLLIDDVDPLLKNKCNLIAYKTSRDVVAIGMFKKDSYGSVQYYDYCILNEFVNICFRKNENGSLNCVFKIIYDDCTTPELTADCLPLFIKDFCDLQSNSGNVRKTKEIMDSVLNKVFSEFKTLPRVQKSETAKSTKTIMSQSSINQTIDKLHKNTVSELKKRILAGETELIKTLQTMNDNPYAYKEIAKFYYSGTGGLERDFEKSIQNYKKAADMFKESTRYQYVECVNQIAAIYCDKDNPNADYDEALSWFCLERDTSSNSYYQHSFCSYKVGNYKDSFTSAVRSIELRDARGYYRLGKLFSDEEINEKIEFLDTDFDLAARCFEESMKTSLKLQSMIQLAKLLIKDKISILDFPMAFDALNQLSKTKGGVWSIRLGEGYYYGKYKLEKDYAKADALFNSSIEHILDDVNATITFSEFILCGQSKLNKTYVKTLIDGVEKNHPDRRQIWVRKGIYLYHGLGYNVDKKGAFEYFMKGLDTYPDNLICESYITKLSIDDSGEKENAHNNFNHLLSLSISDGYYGARSFTYYLIAECYYFGNGTEIDYAKALEYYDKASQHQSMKIFSVFSKMLDCMEKLGINDKRQLIDIARKSKHSSDDKAEETAGDLLVDEDEILAMEYYYESFKNGNTSAERKYLKLLSKHPHIPDVRENLTEKKINALRRLKSTLDSKYGPDNISSKRCERMVGLLSDNLSVGELDDRENVIVRDSPSYPQIH